MARKETITIDIIFEVAFQMAREEGLENVTARRLADRIGCSTQPIFRVYSGMTELGELIFEKAIVYFDDYYDQFVRGSETPFVDLGMAYIHFASAEPKLFQLLFLSENKRGKSMYEILNGSKSAVTKEITKAKINGCEEPSQLFMKMWIFIHGIASMVITGDYDLSEGETAVLLEDSYHAYTGI